MTTVQKDGAAMTRAYSVLDIKSFDDSQRTFTGMATTPAPDRVGDIIEPLGAKFTNPLPLLFQHDSSLPIGTATFGKPTSKGIPFTAKIAEVDAPPSLKDRLDTAWASVRSKLMRGVSIGFRSLEHSRMESGGIRFIETEIMELSVVTIPANAEATIDTIKQFDSPRPAESGIVRISPPGVTGHPVVKITPEEGASKMSLNINQQIDSFKTERAKHVGVMTSLFEAADGATFDAAQQETYDEAEQAVETIDKHLTRLNKHQATMASQATTVVAAPEGNKAASVVLTAHRDNAIAVAKKSAPGVGFARFAVLMAQSNGNFEQAAAHAKEQFPEERPLHDLFKLYSARKVDNLRLAHGEFDSVMKTAVAGGLTTDAHWAAPLVYAQNLADEFIAWNRPRNVVDRFPARAVPFNCRVPRQVTGGAAYWVGEGKPKPLTSFNFETVTLGYTKIANIAVITEELARLSSPNAEMLVRDQLGQAINQQLDADFLDPANSGTTNVKPASITNGGIAIPSTGTNYAALVTDVKSAFNAWIANNMSTSSGVWIMSESAALSLSLILNPLGQPYFPGLNQDGGTFFGLPVIVSQTAGLHGTSGSESIMVLANPSLILKADDGRVTVNASREASLQMLDNPTNASSDGTATTMVSMFQTNSIAILAERWVTWTKARAEAVVYITNANYG